MTRVQIPKLPHKLLQRNSPDNKKVMGIHIDMPGKQGDINTEYIVNMKKKHNQILPTV
jgi:hypothetical protein